MIEHCISRDISADTGLVHLVPQGDNTPCGLGWSRKVSGDEKIEGKVVVDTSWADDSLPYKALCWGTAGC